MRKRILGAAGRLFPALRPKVGLAALLVMAFMPPAWGAAWHGKCDVRFRGTSTLHAFTGNVPCQPFQVGAADTTDGKTVIPGAEVAVLTAAMDTGNKTRDRQMRAMFQSDKFPRVRGIFGRIDPEKIRQEFRRSREGTVPLDFTLAIRDIERPVHAVASNFRETDRGVSFDVDYDVSLSDFGLVPPKAFFGLVSVGDKVTVRTTVRLETGGGN